MQWEPLFVQGAWRITAEPRYDARGSFTPLIDAALFAARGLCTQFHQHAVSNNALAGTLRGMHYQAAPYAEAKLVRVSRGAIYDVILDMRADSPTYRQHYATELTEHNHTLLYIPPGCAHGFLTLADNSDITYHISQPYIEAAQRGLRWNDPKLGIAWPREVRVISPRDAAFADWESSNEPHLGHRD